MTREESYDLLREVIAIIKKWQSKEVKPSMTFTGDLDFSAQTLAILAVRLNRRYGGFNETPGLTGDMISTAGNVRGLEVLIWEMIGDE